MNEDVNTADTTHGILIVDDTPANLELLSAMLEERGYQARAVPSGKLALMSALADPPDLILLDINMPEMNGFEVCARLKADPKLKDIPVIFLSAYTETLDKVKGFSLGAVDYLTKPFHIEEIVARVNTHIEIQSLHRQLRKHNESLEKLVSERTIELAKACERLKEHGQLKNDFLCMISHEVRTPANGLLTIGEMMLDLCPPSVEVDSYRDIFKTSSSRLRNLIDDATMLMDMELLDKDNESAIAFPILLAEALSALPGIRVSVQPASHIDTVFLRGDPVLLISAMKTVVELSALLSKNVNDKNSAHMTVDIDGRHLRAIFKINKLSISEKEADDFFDLCSFVRCGSHAEALGLAPVVAGRILAAFGGGLRLLKDDDESGCVEALLLIDNP